jgi:hypothetical protein
VYIMRFGALMVVNIYVMRIEAFVTVNIMVYIIKFESHTAVNIMTRVLTPPETIVPICQTSRCLT